MGGREQEDMITHAFTCMDMGAFEVSVVSSCVGTLIQRLTHAPLDDPFERNEQCIVPVVLAEKGSCVGKVVVSPSVHMDWSCFSSKRAQCTCPFYRKRRSTSSC